MIRARGFSLLETLVAAALFAALAAMAWGGLATIMRGRQVLAAEDAQWLALARQVGRFERDLRQALPRPVAARVGEEPALHGGTTGLNVTVWHPGADTPVERVSWRCDEAGFRRERRAGVDRPAPTTPSPPAGPAHAGCDLQYIDDQGRTSTAWPPPGADPERLPRAVELSLRIPGRGEFHRLLELPDAPAPGAP